MKEQSIQFFLDELSSYKPVPGGGGASSLVAAVGVACGSMVANLTLGKKKYESVQSEIEKILVKLEKLKTEFELLIKNRI